ncbi:manganese efflux pump MntP [Thalassotalea profundi]|uniref:Putative manganese efflux pump MntP n=1 Tax=Thalassotalea profundi TaxID=2036687 RepID=A0ABQ3IMM4_9GAMM|nr:manganese efflux pump MntP family protein [Thalassotalea profundi]GHE88220.1 membrane protein [Thalassotalea profundi]
MLLEVLALAIALSMDAFAVSLSLGAKRTQPVMSVAILSAIYFGLFQAIMPLIGYAGGMGILGWVEHYAPWIAFVLLIAIGSKMIYESFGDHDNRAISKITHKLMFILAIATSIDAMAAGFTLTLIDFDPYFSCFLIGITTFVFSGVGVYIGKISGTWLESKAEFFGGLVLIFIGIKILIF